MRVGWMYERRIDVQAFDENTLLPRPPPLHACTMQLRIGNYLGDAEDQREGFTPLEHAIVYGYSLNSAISLYTRRVW